jgi:stage II sporulation protein M
MQENATRRKLFLISGALLLLSILVGYIAGIANPEYAHNIVGKFSSTFGPIKLQPNYVIFLFIFLNNSIKALFTILFGFFFGLFPLYFLVTNGVIIGLVASVSNDRIGWAGTLAGLLPHGVIELSALIIASGYGIWLGGKFYRSLRYEEPFRDAFLYSLKIYLKVIIPMLLFAALIETFITPLAIDYFAR